MHCMDENFQKYIEEKFAAMENYLVTIDERLRRVENTAITDLRSRVDILEDENYDLKARMERR